MPRYDYVCNRCEREFVIFHSMSDTAGSCEDCGDVLSKSYTSKYSFNEKIQKGPRKVGSLMNDFIEESRKELERDKEDLLSRNIK